MPGAVDAFLEAAALAGAAPPTDVAPLAAALAALWQAATAGWSQPPVDAEVFAAYAAARLAAGSEPAGALAELRAAELYLACACAAGDGRAIGVLDRDYLAGVEPILRSLRADDDQLGEIVQQVRTKLLVGSEGRAPRIEEYAGRGDLRRWLRTTAVHLYYNLLRSQQRDFLVDDDRFFDALLTPQTDPELAVLKARHRAEFRAAFTEAVGELSDRDKNLLRYRHLDELEVGEIGALYRVHRATAHRWLIDARAALARATERALRRRFGVDAGEIESIRQLIESQLDLSLSRLLRG